MTDSVIVALIGAAALVVVAILTGRQNLRLRRIETDAKATRTQVENGHATNMREESDERHSENSTKLDRALELLHDHGESLRRLWRTVDTQQTHLEELDELTHPRSRFAPPNARHRKESQ